jgi:hypothetical protein
MGHSSSVIVVRFNARTRARLFIIVAENAANDKPLFPAKICARGFDSAGSAMYNQGI